MLKLSNGFERENKKKKKIITSFDNGSYVNKLHVMAVYKGEKNALVQ